jgi:hypothetical protein
MLLLVFILLVEQCVSLKAPPSPVLVHLSTSTSLKQSSISPDESDSLRLQRARLRLAEAQGIIPIGASEDPNGISLKEYKSMPTQSKVREISWRVAEPAVKVSLNSTHFDRTWIRNFDDRTLKKYICIELIMLVRSRWCCIEVLLATAGLA